MPQDGNTSKIANVIVHMSIHINILDNDMDQSLELQILEAVRNRLTGNLYHLFISIHAVDLGLQSGKIKYGSYIGIVDQPLTLLIFHPQALSCDWAWNDQFTLHHSQRPIAINIHIMIEQTMFKGELFPDCCSPRVWQIMKDSEYFTNLWSHS